MQTKLMIAAVAALTGALAEAGELKANGCFADWTETTLTVGNRLFSRTYGAGGDDIRTMSFVAYGSEWIDSARVDKTGSKLVVTADAARRSPVGADGLKVVVKTGAKTRTLWLFPSVPGVLLEDPTVIDLSKWVPSERLYNNVYRKLQHYLAGADRLHLKPLHVTATEYELRDMTDIRNELVEENSWLLMTREEPLLRSAPVVSVEDTFTARGLVFLRLAPLPNDRPVVLPDFSFAAAEGGGRPNQVYLASVANGYPVAELAYEGGENGRIRALHAVQRALRPYRAGRDGQFLSNTWGDGHRDARINADFMMAEVKAGGELGVDVIQIDDGWQSGKSHNSALITNRNQGVWGNFRAGNPNFWKPDAEKFPGGLGPIVAAAKDRGMGFGLWFGPDKTDDYAAWEEDAKTLVDFYRAYGIRYFKIDGIGMGSEMGFANIRRFFDRMLVDSNGEMTFDLDVTGAAKRPAYFGLPDIGPLFVENRYIGGEGTGKAGLYWPHFTLRNVWTLSKLIDPVRLRVEICNPLRGQFAFGDDPLAPKFWRGDALFASVMVGSPLGWFEISELDPKTVAEMKPLVARWKLERAAMHGGETLPVGSAPDGRAWTGFASLAADGRTGYAVLFRELNEKAEFELDFADVFPGVRFAKAEVIGGRGDVELDDGTELEVKVPEKLGFVWVRLTSGRQL